jgi:hypothetical protein
MARYYFDVRDNDTFIEDDVGVELPSLEIVKRDAAKALAEIARDVLPGSVVRTLTVEVRDDTGPILKAILRFEVEHVRERAQGETSQPTDSAPVHASGSSTTLVCAMGCRDRSKKASYK